MCILLRVSPGLSPVRDSNWFVTLDGVSIPGGWGGGLGEGLGHGCLVHFVKRPYFNHPNNK